MANLVMYIVRRRTIKERVNKLLKIKQISDGVTSRCRGTTTAEKLRGTKVWVSSAPRPAEGWVGCWVREGSCEGPGVSPPENF